ncbi:hypothetical protein SAMN05444920_10758 [Nonomuraea solani]|uniref:Uncharacterized protein n=1 Tax=Nonomuraea solani TaxID=1144553 RepID=A0A1H6E0W4_9ACTN|nr:hypothetical protein [Nonomuraea solani]SEG90575.1 hypothetical protein SAMN05444920_10758 [Nonomuraea solani]
MRRHRSGRIAAFAAAGYGLVAIAAGVATPATGRLDHAWWLVVHDSPLMDFTVRWWLVLLLAPVAAVQGWAYWQILPGPARGDPRPAGHPPAPDVVRLRRQRLLVMAYPAEGDKVVTYRKR